MRSKFIAGAIAIVASLVIAAPALGHVTAQPPEQPSGGFTVVTFRVPSEQDAPTTKVEVQFPEGVSSARTQPVPGWTAEVNMDTLDEPIDDGHGGKVTEQVTSITWSGGEINAGEFQEFPVSFKMVEEGDLGDTVFFPAVQTYEGGEEVAWTEKPASADDDAELERPAPSVTLVAAGDGGHGAMDADAKADDHADEAAADDSADDSKHTDSAMDDIEMRANVALGIAIAALVLALLGLFVKRGRKD